MSTTTEFEIEFKKANWRVNTVDTDVKKNATKYSMETFDTTALNNIFSFIPYVGSQVSSVFKKEIVGAATAPCTVKRKMTVSAVYTGSLANGAHAKYESTIQIYSIEPKDPTDKKVTVFVGDYEHMNAGFLSIPLSFFGISFGEVGPIISCKAGILPAISPHGSILMTNGRRMKTAMSTRSASLFTPAPRTESPAALPDRTV